MSIIIVEVEDGYRGLVQRVLPNPFSLQVRYGIRHDPNENCVCPVPVLACHF